MLFTTMDAIRLLCVERCKLSVTSIMSYNLVSDHGDYDKNTFSVTNYFIT